MIGSNQLFAVAATAPMGRPTRRRATTSFGQALPFRCIDTSTGFGVVVGLVITEVGDAGVAAPLRELGLGRR